MVEQELLLSEALAASVEVQVDEDFLTNSETREGPGAAATRLAARPTQSKCERYKGMIADNSVQQNEGLKEWPVTVSDDDYQGVHLLGLVMS